MSVTASCKFPFLDKWKKICEKNKILEFIDSVLSGHAQMAFNDNSFSGIVLIVAIYIASPIQAVSGVWATIVATLVAYLIGVPRGLITSGLYGFNAALTGLAIPALIFSGSGLTSGLFLYSTLGGLLSVLLTASFGNFFSKWDIPTLALPFCITIFILVPASVLFSGLHGSVSAPMVIEIAAQEQNVWTMSEFITASLNGLSQVIWVNNIGSSILYLLAILMASRIDVFSTILATLVSTSGGIAFGLPKDFMLLGLHGFNAVLLMQVITRAYVANVYSYILGSVLSVCTVIFTAALTVLFAPIGEVSSTAFPYVIVCFLALSARDVFRNLKYVPARNWGVPEEINKKLKNDTIE